MIVRKIKPEEFKRTEEIFSIAFESAMDNSKSANEYYQEVISDSQSREAYYWQERWAAFEDDDQTMMSYFVATPFPVHFDKHNCKMIGIGGVATLPQYRRSGGIRACFTAALPDMYAKGASFSYLYPFSTAYYRKFGYEMCCERFQYKILLSAIPNTKLEGSCILVEPDHCYLEDIKKIYETWQNQYNMMVINEDFEYAWVLNSNPAKDQIFTYVYKSKAGIPKGFMTFQLEQNGYERNLKCKRFFFTDREGFQGLLSILHSCCSDHLYATFELPTNLNITPLLPEWSLGAASCQTHYCGMVRVINVKQVLEMASYHGTGSLVIDLQDDYIEQNNGKFLVEFENDRAKNVRTTDTPADISIGISDFSRMIVGACDTSALEYMSTAKIFTDMNSLSKVFYKKPTLITEYF